MFTVFFEFNSGVVLFLNSKTFYIYFNEIIKWSLKKTRLSTRDTRPCNNVVSMLVFINVFWNSRCAYSKRLLAKFSKNLIHQFVFKVLWIEPVNSQNEMGPQTTTLVPDTGLPSRTLNVTHVLCFSRYTNQTLEISRIVITLDNTLFLFYFV